MPYTEGQTGHLQKHADIDAALAARVTTAGLDAATTALDANAASAFRVQADARQAAKLDKTEAVVRYDGAAQLPEAGAFMRKMVLGTANAALLVLGDSTGQGNMTTIKRWPLRFAELMMALFPTHTIIFYMWNNTSVAYDAPVTLQTGSGTRTLTIYNGSASGMATNYSITNLAVLAPVEPDLTIINHGHNESSTTLKTNLTKLARFVAAKWPRSPIVLTSQNPQTSASPSYVDQMAARVVVGDVAAREGFGLLDIATAFTAYPSWDTALFTGDYTHPNDSGMALWAAEVFARFQRAPRALARRGRAVSDRIYVPASAFQPSTGSPTMSYTTAGAARSGWALDPVVAEAVSAVVDVPLDWVSLNLHVFWTTLVAAGTAGVMSMSVGIGASRGVIGQADTVYPSADSTITTFGTGMTLSETVPAAGEVAYVRKRTYTYGTSNAYPATRGVHEMSVTRNGNSGSDTLPVDAIFLGVLFERIE